MGATRGRNPRLAPPEGHRSALRQRSDVTGNDDTSQMSNTIASNHIVVDGSNIATEGREMPSLAQLNEAVTTFMELHPDAQVTVVVDATFGHRIDASERAEFDAGVANNELVAPPAGAVGRGDAFVLTIAQRVGATVLSNDSFQEFHAEHEWLFDEGRLVGGKPVPHVGWVFVARTPVRGPKSKRATRDARRKSGSARAPKASPMASEPMPVPTSPPPGRVTRSASAPAPEPAATSSGGGAASTVNELLPFLEFIGEHPVGTAVSGVVESYSSHGAYVRVKELAVYVPLRLMSDPPPRSARKALRLGDEVTVVIAGTVPDRRSIDAGLPGMVPSAGGADAVAPAAVKKTAGKKAAAKKTVTKKITAKKRTAKKAVTKKSTAQKAVAKKVTAKKAATKQVVAKKAATKKVAAKKSAAKKSAAKKSTAKGRS